MCRRSLSFSKTLPDVVGMRAAGGRQEEERTVRRGCRAAGRLLFFPAAADISVSCLGRVRGGRAGSAGSEEGSRALHGVKFFNPLQPNPFANLRTHPYPGFSSQKSPFPPVPVWRLNIHFKPKCQSRNIGTQSVTKTYKTSALAGTS